jgi:TIR domain
MQSPFFVVPTLLLAFIAVCGLFLVGSRFFARRSTELWLVAMSLALVTPVTIVPVVVMGGALGDRESLYQAIDGTFTYIGSIALAVIWWLTRGRPRSLNTQASVHPLGVVVIPISGFILKLLLVNWYWGLLKPILIALIQLAVIGLLRRKLTSEPVHAVFAKPTSDSVVSQHEPSIPLQRPASTAIPPAPLPTPAPPEHSQPPTVASSVARHQKIFLSYRREDSADVAGRIYDRLVQQFGKEQVFKDVDSIPLGVDFRKHLAGMVGSCDILLAVIGVNWQTADRPEGKTRLDDPKDFVRIELESALQRDIPVIPVLVRGAQIPDESHLPTTLATLAYRNGIAVRADPDFHRDMDRLIEGVQSHLASLS